MKYGTLLSIAYNGKNIGAVAYKLNEIMKERIIEIVEIGQPQSLIQRENAPITELIKTDILIEELNEQLRIYNVMCEFHCERFDFGRGKKCEQQCSDCYWMQTKSQ